MSHRATSKDASLRALDPPSRSLPSPLLHDEHAQEAEPLGRQRVRASQPDPSACDCDLCGSKGVASPPDGKVNVHDVLKFLMHMHAGEGKPMNRDDHPCDVNRDAVVDVSDLLLIFKRFGSTCAEHEDAGWHGLHFGSDWNPVHLFNKPQDTGL